MGLLWEGHTGVHIVLAIYVVWVLKGLSPVCVGKSINVCLFNDLDEFILFVCFKNSIIIVVVVIILWTCLHVQPIFVEFLHGLKRIDVININI